jgi:Flp pilus assembly protein TadD
MVLSRLNRSAESLQSFREAIRLRPDYWEAHYTLGGELGMHDQVSEARSEFETVVRLNPNFAWAHLNLGVALLKQGELDGAQRQFEETLRLEPGNKLAPGYLRQAEAMKNHRQ